MKIWRTLFSGRHLASTQALAPPVPAAAVAGSGGIHIVSAEGSIRLEDGHLALDVPGRSLRIQLVRVASVSLHGGGSITTPALCRLMDEGIPVVFRSRTGHYRGQIADLSGQSSRIRRAHYAAAADVLRRLEIAKAIVLAKISNTIAFHVRRDGETWLLRRLRAIAARAVLAKDVGELLGLEGAAAAFHFRRLGVLFEAAQPGFTFHGRTRRPPADAPNALLSYLYAVLTGECATAVLGAGLDPGIGMLHAERPGRPSLALDLVEPLRPLVADALALALVRRREIAPADFERHETAVALTPSGRKVLLAALEVRMSRPWRAGADETISLRAAIRKEAGDLASALAAGSAWRPALVQS